MELFEPQKLDDLTQTFLAKSKVPLEKWAPPDAKTPADLLGEIQSGECLLSLAPLCRVLKVVRLQITRPGSQEVLIEVAVRQLDGMTARRNRRPSEKMLPGESPEDAAIRGIVEELGSQPAEITILDCKAPVERTVESSPSYPGLPSRYQFFDVDCQVEGLPVGDFSTVEVSNGSEIHHDWSWREPNIEAGVQ